MPTLKKNQFNQKKNDAPLSKPSLLSNKKQ